MASSDVASPALAAIAASIFAQCEQDQRKVLRDQSVGLGIVRDAVRRRGLMLHGGMAVNAVLPASKRFYGADEVPDYDALVPDDTGKETRRIMFEVQGRLTAADYWAHFQPAVHDSTQKLRAHPRGITRLQAMRYPNILDATSVPRGDFERLRALSEAEKSLRRPEFRAFLLIPTAYMKMSMHLEFSRPSVHIRRWEKLFPRCALLYEAFPRAEVAVPGRSAATGARKGARAKAGPKSGAKAGPKSGAKRGGAGGAGAGAETFDAATAGAVAELVSRQEGGFAVGERAARRVMGAAGAAGGGRVRADFVVSDLSAVHDGLSEAGLAPGDLVPASTFLPEHFFVGCSAVVFAWEECTAVVGPPGALCGNSDAILRYQYGEYLQYGRLGVIDELAAFQLRQGSESLTSGMGRRFGTECV